MTILFSTFHWDFWQKFFYLNFFTAKKDFLTKVFLYTHVKVHNFEVTIYKILQKDSSAIIVIV